MKTNNFLSVLAGLMMLVAGATVCSCSKGGDEDVRDVKDAIGYESAFSEGGERGDKADASASDGEGSTSNGDSQGGNTEAGVMTAGEWSDLNHWDFWSKLMTGEEYAGKSDYWKCYTNNRVAIQVADEGGRAADGIPVKLIRLTDEGQTVVWETVTDNHGQAECWLSLWQKSSEVNASTLRVMVNGQLMEQPVVVSDWTSQQQLANRFVCSLATTGNIRNTDIAFIVDATGSMMDEINFLKNDLVDIINNVSTYAGIRTAALFYRDEGDEYLTRQSDFTPDIHTTAEFVDRQSADGGGDYPEAVHTALERMLKNLSWDDNARTRLAFLILDAPAHHETGIISSLQQSVQECARRGIRLIPVAASGVDKNTEFMLRFFAIATGGTYVFLTNDSGVGFDHIQATVGDYEVEQLNALIIRLINYYTE